MAGIKRDLKVAIMLELDADYYLEVNFVREFQAVLDPCKNQLLIKPAKRFVELELASVLGVNPERYGFSLRRESELACCDWVEQKIDVGDVRPIKAILPVLTES